MEGNKIIHIQPRGERNFQEDLDGLELNYLTKTNKEVAEVSNSNYVNQKELNHLEEKIDLKITNAVQPIEGKIDNLQTEINGKFETLEQKIENMFLNQKEEIREERQENIKWIIGTAIALAGLLYAIL